MKYKYIYNDKQHSLEHIEYISLYILFILSLLIWITFSYIQWLDLQILTIPLFLMNVANMVQIKHIVNERHNEIHNEL